MTSKYSLLGNGLYGSKSTATSTHGSSGSSWLAYDLATTPQPLRILTNDSTFLVIHGHQTLDRNRAVMQQQQALVFEDYWELRSYFLLRGCLHKNIIDLQKSYSFL